jgi:AcrR family transcriptional regulator
MRAVTKPVSQASRADQSERADRASQPGQDPRPVPAPEATPESPGAVGSGPVDGGSGVPAGGDGRVSRARRLREERSAQIQGVARQLFAERGYHGTKLQDILDGAGIARGTFYLHFDGKRAVFDHLVDDFLARIRAVVTPVDVGPSAPSPLTQIEENLLRVTRVLYDHRDLTRIVLLSAEGLDAEADAKMADFYGKLHQLLATAFERGQHMRLLRACDAQVVAHAALGSLKEVALQWIVRQGGGQGGSDRAQLVHVCREVLAYGLYGLFRTDG